METHSVDSIEYVKSMNHELGQLNDFLYYLYFPRALVAFLSLTQEIVDSNTTFYKNM